TDASSAHTSAPHKVNAPAASHTSMTPPVLGIRRVISDGWIKIDAPTMIPTTRAVAWESPIERRSAGGMESRDSIMLKEPQRRRAATRSNTQTLPHIRYLSVQAPATQGTRRKTRPTTGES